LKNAAQLFEAGVQVIQCPVSRNSIGNIRVDGLAFGASRLGASASLKQ
jgi:hypothetical protein